MEEEIKRLLRCGFSEKSAIDICEKYYREQDYYNLERYIRFAEIILGNGRVLKEEK